ncbi:MAG TPA: hypothetical protein VMY39_01990 [Planctomycetota bacterium]|nr:hypothetical protein [Planctomycetota bacterium]HUV38349.1 hypothetical protein [Planctomycetota bacterium]
MEIDPAELILIVMNLLAGLGCAVPLARHLRGMTGKPRRTSRTFAVLVGIYLVECVALIVGMGIPVFSVALALVWGVVFARWLGSRAPERQVVRASFFLALYASLPAFSFIVVPVVAFLSGWAVWSVEGGTRFGIPGFIPWPMNTILGFFAACAVGAAVLKTLITTSEVRWLMRRKTLSSTAR